MTPLLLLLGPTASGKSALSLSLAERYGGEIVTVDSAQVYRGMDIGTAKPDTGEQARVPHHLLDIVDPAEAYSAARFVQDARAAIAAIRARGRVPVLAGGTMLYFQALMHGLSDLPTADAALRADIAARARRLGWPALHAELATLDPDSAARLHPNDRSRIQRALEICLVSGQPASRMLQGAPRPDLGPVRAVIWAPYPRRALGERIRARFEAMLAAGFVDEVRRLHARGDLHAELPSMRAVGYRQLWAWLDGEIDWDTAVQRALKATRLLAKRQWTWLGGGLVEKRLVPEPDCVFNASGSEDPAAVMNWCDARMSQALKY